jgi:hypothetical protein
MPAFFWYCSRMAACVALRRRHCRRSLVCRRRRHRCRCLLALPPLLPLPTPPLASGEDDEEGEEERKETTTNKRKGDLIERDTTHTQAFPTYLRSRYSLILRIAIATNWIDLCVVSSPASSSSTPLPPPPPSPTSSYRPTILKKRLHLKSAPTSSWPSAFAANIELLPSNRADPNRAPSPAVAPPIRLVLLVTTRQTKGAVRILVDELCQ